MIDPRDGAVRYVGSTINPEHRLTCHIGDHKCIKGKYGPWLYDLVESGQRPIMKILEETIQGKRFEVEAKWIQFFSLSVLNVQLLK